MSQTTLRVAAPPEKPLLIFDGACTFCSLWVQRWQRFSHGAFDCVPLLDPGLAARFPELTREQFERAVHFISTDGSVFVGAEAVFHALACHSNGAWIMDWYRQSPAFARSAEAVYGFVAGHRGFFSFFTRLLWGRQVQPPSYAIVRWLFLRALGLIYLAAFLSLWPQVTGLIGNQGIIPAEQTMSAVRSEMDLQHVNFQRYQLVPTLCWFSAKDSFLKFQCGAGALLAILLVVDIAPVPCLFLL
jgi:predicted DCC family thiol-disulfide oxidoreductase YuxK